MRNQKKNKNQRRLLLLLVLSAVVLQSNLNYLAIITPTVASAMPLGGL